MIKYNLLCSSCSENFDSWFPSSKEFEKLKKLKLINCPNCNSFNVKKSLMSPSVINKKNDNNNLDSKKYLEIKNKQNYQILNETKTLHQKNSHFSKVQIKEFSILFIMLNFPKIVLKKIEDISKIIFLSEKNESLKKIIISSLLEGDNGEKIQSKISADYKKLIEEIQENSNIQIIVKVKNDEAILELLSELLIELEELNNLKKIESLEKELINNLDENSYSELIKLKSQVNRE